MNPNSEPTLISTPHKDYVTVSMLPDLTNDALAKELADEFIKETKFDTFRAALIAQVVKRLTAPGKVKRKNMPTCSREELLAICQRLETPNPEQDAEGLFCKWLENDWTNGKKKIKDVELTVRAWKAQGYLPSQRFNMKTQTAPSKFTNVPAQIRAVDEQIRLHVANPNGPKFFSGCTQSDKDTLKALRERKAQLTAQLAQG